MDKLRLKKIRLNESPKILSDEELKNVIGGYEAANSCYTKCKPDDCPKTKPACNRIGATSDCACEAGSSTYY